MNRTGSQRVSVTLTELLQLSSNGRSFSLSALRRTHLQTGQHQSRLLARGMEFAETRRYQHGDDIRNIDWKVTARTGKTHTKLFAAEKEKRILVAVDLQSSMFFATRGLFKSVQAALMIGTVAWSAALKGDRLGGIIFDGTNTFESRPALGKKGLFPFLQGLADRVTINRVRGAMPTEEAMDSAITHLHRITKPGSLVFFASDFRHLSRSAHNLLMQISLHSDLCLCFIYDPLEKELPEKGLYPLTDNKTEYELNCDIKTNREKYKERFFERREKIAALSRQGHIHFIECSTEDDNFEILMKHFSKR